MTATEIAPPSGLTQEQLERWAIMEGERAAIANWESEWAVEREQRIAKITSERRELETARRGGGGKLARSETVTVRLDPRLRYLAELAARKQRRTLSSYIEWAIEKSLADVVLSTRYSGESLEHEETTTLADQAGELWDVDPAERLARLAMIHESLLTHDEQVLWKQVKDSGLLAKGWIPTRTEGGAWTAGRPDWKWLKEVGFPLLRDHWENLCKVASGELDRSHLPRFDK